MRDENDEALSYDGDGSLSDDNVESTVKIVDDSRNKLEARRKIERLREIKQLRQQLGDDWDDDLLDDL